MLTKTTGIVLNQIKYGDSSLIIHVYTQKSGRQAMIIKGVRSRKSRVKANLFSPLNILNIEYYDREGKDLKILKEASRDIIFHSFPFDLKKELQAMFIAEVLSKCLREEIADTDLFDFITHSLEYFDHMQSESANFHLSFLMKLTKFLGILPSIHPDKKISVLDMIEGEFRNDVPEHLQHTKKENTALIQKLFVENFEKASSIPLHREKRNSVLEDILKFYSLNGYPVESLKSASVLQELFVDGK